MSYLSAAPLGWYFLHGPAKHDFVIVPGSPAKCAEWLAGGEVDVGLIPSIEYQRIPHLRVIPDIAIAATHEVRYLRVNLDHNLGPAHKEGLERFYRLAFEAGLIEEFKPVDYLV